MWLLVDHPGLISFKQMAGRVFFGVYEPTTLDIFALLLAGKFIQLNLNSKGVYSVKVVMDECESFFDQYGLTARGSSERDGVTSDLQLGSVYNDALTADKPTEN